jgi:hypothetical protein
VFTFPKSAKKQLVVQNENIPNTNDNLFEEKSKKIISHYETVFTRYAKHGNKSKKYLNVSENGT